MKQIIITIKSCLFLALFGASVQAQTISYEVVKDNPEEVRNQFIAVEFLNADIGGKSNLNTVGIGANAVFGLSPKHGVEGRFGYALFKDEALGASFNFEAGSYINLTSNKKTKDVKVRIGGEFDTKENERVYNESFIHVPGTNLNKHGLRGGVYLYKKGYKAIEISGWPELPYTLLGVYGGWSLVQKTNLVVQIKGSSDSNDDVPSKPLFYTGFSRFFIDAILTPVATREIPNGIAEDQLPSINKLIGGRVGFQFYKDGPKWYNKFMWGIETGLRPIEGFYFATNLGYSIYRKK